MTDKEEIKNLKKRIVKANKRMVKLVEAERKKTEKLEKECRFQFDLLYDVYHSFRSNIHPHPEPMDWGKR